MYLNTNKLFKLFMYTILLIKTNGDIIEKKIKEYDVNIIYKYCNYRNNNEFKHLTTYSIKKSQYTYSLYGKINGRANNENKYDLPPPIDSKLFFGTLCIIKKENENIVSIKKEEWNKVYETLFGGFEDLNDDETRSEDSEIYDDEDYTKEGYLKDNFVIDDDDELEEEEYVDE